MANTPNLDLENVNVLLDTEYAYNQLVSEIIAKINNNNLKIDELPNDFILSTEKGVVNGVASLGNDGIIPTAQLPLDSGSVERVADILARDAIVNLYDNKLVFVIDASDDITVTSGWAMYIYSIASLSWTKIVDGESLDISLTWDEILNKPEVFPPETHDHTQITTNANDIADLQNNKVDKVLDSRLVSETEIEVFNDKYSKTEVDDKIADVTFPLATTLVDGLMSKEYVTQVDTNKTDILSAKMKLGDVAITTTAQIVTGAINELDADIGDKSTLTTTDKTNLVNAVNENRTQINSFTPHLTKSVTDAEGVHGLKIESGTFTPYCMGSTIAGEYTYSSNTKGRYTRVNKLVYFNLYVALSGVITAGTGILLIAGLPFTSVNIGANKMALNIGNINNIIFDASKIVSALVHENQSTAQIMQSTSNGAAAALAPDALKSNSIFAISGYYEIN